MPQADFAYLPANDAAVMPLAVSIFADLPRLRDELATDVAAAGLALRMCGTVAALLEGEARPLGEIVLLDCPALDAAAIAALARLDQRAARSGAQLVISTTVAALDDVFACCDRSAPQILVDPTHAERIVALSQVAQRLAQLSGAQPAVFGDDKAFYLESPRRGFGGPPKDGDDGDRLVRTPRPPLPEPRVVRRIIRQRQLRAKFFDRGLFADPAWDILLDLTAAKAEQTRVSVTSLCIASGVPPTTALRWIGQMTDAGLLERVEDEADRRRAFITLSDPAAEAMARYFAELGRSAPQLI
jgi:DNA-binding MarR family transcriptional regulator